MNVTPKANNSLLDQDTTTVVVKFINEYLEQLPNELISLILENLTMEHLILVFLSLHHLPIVRRIVISQYFSKSIILSLLGDKECYELDQTTTKFEEDYDRYRYRKEEDYNKVYHNYLLENWEYHYYDKYHTYKGANIRAERDSDGSNIWSMDKMKHPNRFHNYFNDRELVDEILSHKDLKFAKLHLVCSVYDTLKLLSKDTSSSIIKNSKEIQLTIMFRITIQKNQLRRIIQRIPNIVQLEFFQCTIAFFSFKFHGYLNYQNLERLTLSHVDTSEWDILSLPSMLRKLEIASVESFHINLVQFPNSLRELSFIDVEIKLDEFLDTKFPDSLTHLKCCRCTLDNQCVMYSLCKQLPKCLTSIVFKNNKSSLRVDQSLQDKSPLTNNKPYIWPQHLRTLWLDSFLTINTIRILNKFGWPKHITTLNLHLNYSRINIAINFPDSVTYLRMTSSLLDYTERLQDSQIKLPRYLQSLYIRGFDFSFQDIQFPETMQELCLSRCRGIDFRTIRLPLKLQVLTIAGCKFCNLCDFQHWKDLTNLDYLSLQGNNIVSLSDWVPPPNLISLVLAENKIPNINKNIPIFSQNSDKLLPHLSELYMTKNLFQTYPSDLIFPPNLKVSTILREFTKEQYEVVFSSQ